MLNRSFAAAAVLLLCACWGEGAPERTTSPTASPSSRVIGDSPLADTLARAVAIALASPGARQLLHAALRDSPFAHHALHLRSFLAGSDGLALRDAAAAALRTDGAGLERMLAALPDLELRLERPYDRATWAGNDSVAVYGTTLATEPRVRAAASQPGFRAGGAAVSIPIWSAAPFPYLAIQPVETSFGPDPERARRLAPRHIRATVSTRAEEVASYLISTCDPDTDYGCGGGMLPDDGGVTLPSLYTRDYCFGLGTSTPITSAEDLDSDRFRDGCERLLASTFRPVRLISGSDRAPYGEPKFSAARRAPDFDGRAEVAIFYALSYYRDPGSPIGSIEAHDGDSEFIIVEIHAAQGSRWVADYVTFSAHWNAGWGVDHTSRYFQDVLEWSGGSRARVRSWVSTDKHANYRSRSVCMSQWNDFCGYEYSYSARDTPLVEPANLGGLYNAFTPTVGPINNCQRSASPLAYTGIECYWNFGPFAGWHPLNGQATATSYTQSLGFFGF